MPENAAFVSQRIPIFAASASPTFFFSLKNDHLKDKILNSKEAPFFAHCLAHHGPNSAVWHNATELTICFLEGWQAE